MQIYNYNDNGIYTGPSNAKPDPLVMGGWLIPRNATTIQPPVTGVNESARFSNGSWVTLIDFRGHSVWRKSNATHFVVTDFGPIPVDYTLLDPTGTEYPMWVNDHWETDTVARDAAIAEEIRVSEIEDAQEATGLRKISLAQAENFLTTEITKLDSLSVPERGILRDVLLKIVTRVLKVI